MARSWATSAMRADGSRTPVLSLNRCWSCTMRLSIVAIELSKYVLRPESSFNISHHVHHISIPSKGSLPSSNYPCLIESELEHVRLGLFCKQRWSRCRKGRQVLGQTVPPVSYVMNLIRARRHGCTKPPVTPDLAPGCCSDSAVHTVVLTNTNI